MSAKNRLRSNKKQIEVMVDFLATHNHLATGEFSGPLGAKRADSQWQILKEMLKEYGPDRSIEQWKQTWKDLKKQARSENAASSRARHSTGNIISVPVVSNVGTKVLSIIGHECSTGIGPEESQIGQSDIIEVTTLEHEENAFHLHPPSSYADENALPISSSSFIASSTPIPFSTPIPPFPPCTASLIITSSAAETSQKENRNKNPSTSRPYDKFATLQEENNSILKSIDERLKVRNELLSEQNNLLREQNTYLRNKNKIKRKNR